MLLKYKIQSGLKMKMSPKDLGQNVLIQGFKGSFHHIVAQKFFGSEVNIIPCYSFYELVQRLQKDESTHSAIMAIENSIAGSILPNYGLLEKSQLNIIGEAYLHIRQNLMALEGQNIKDLEEVHSHPMALHQCRPFFDQYPHIKLVESFDTALSAREISEQKITKRGAIAPQLASELFNLPVLERDIHTDKKNYTRFLILKRDSEHFVDPTSNKASIFFEVADEVGSLAKVLTYLSFKKINLTKLQSFPILGKEWQYYIHADLEFSQLDVFNETIDNLVHITSALKVLGIYPIGKKEN